MLLRTTCPQSGPCGSPEVPDLALLTYLKYLPQATTTQNHRHLGPSFLG
jgi:hypothetical protein